MEMWSEIEGRRSLSNEELMSYKWCQEEMASVGTKLERIAVNYNKHKLEQAQS